jgi:hypothetical protein
MLFWHLGATLWLFRWIFKDPKVDVRFLLLGAVLPDLVDLTVGTILFPERYSTGELWFHTLLVASAYMVVVLFLTRRGRRRRAFMALGVGWLFHLLLDGMWTDPELFFWPFFGWEMPSGEAPFWPLAWERAMSDPWRWVLESIGLAYLVWLWLATGLNQRDRREALLHTGRLPARAGSDA